MITQLLVENCFIFLIDPAESHPLPTLNSACLPEEYEGKIVFGQDEYQIK